MERNIAITDEGVVMRTEENDIVSWYLMSPVAITAQAAERIMDSADCIVYKTVREF